MLQGLVLDSWYVESDQKLFRIAAVDVLCHGTRRPPSSEHPINTRDPDRGKAARRCPQLLTHIVGPMWD